MQRELRRGCPLVRIRACEGSRAHAPQAAVERGSARVVERLARRGRWRWRWRDRAGCDDPLRRRGCAAGDGRRRWRGALRARTPRPCAQRPRGPLAAHALGRRSPNEPCPLLQRARTACRRELRAVFARARHVACGGRRGWRDGPDRRCGSRRGDRVRRRRAATASGRRQGRVAGHQRHGHRHDDDDADDADADDVLAAHAIRRQPRRCSSACPWLCIEVIARFALLAPR